MAGNDVSIAIRAKNESSATIRQITGDLGGLEKVGGGLNVGSLVTGAIGGVALAGGIDMLMSATQGVYELAKAGDRLMDLRESFGALATGVGQDATSMLSAMREASMGMISDGDLLLSANKALSLGVGENAEDMAKLLERSASIAQAVGSDSASVFGDIVNGIGRLSLRSLGGLGINIDDAKVFDAYAASIDTVATKLDDSQKKTALFNEVIKQTAGLAAPSVDQFDRMDAAIQNSKDALGELFSPAVASIAQSIADATRNVTAELQRQSEIRIQPGLITPISDVVQGPMPRPTSLNAESTQQLADYKQKVADLLPVIAMLDAEIEGLDTSVYGASTQWRVLNSQSSGLKATLADLQGQISTLETAQNNMGRGVWTTVSAWQDFATSTDSASDSMYSAANAAGMAASNIGLLGAQARGTAGVVYDLGNAMAWLNSNTGTIARVQKQAGALQGVASMMIQQGTLVPQDAAAFLEGADAVMGDYIDTLIAAGVHGDALDAATSAYVGNLREANQVVKGHSAGLSEVEKQYNTILGQVRGVVDAAMGDMGGFDLGSVLGRQDAPAENARRLAAIATEGLQGQAWLPEFMAEVPGVYADLMIKQAEGIDVKTAAAQILQQFQDGMRPELIDKETVKQRVRSMILGDQNASTLANEIASELAAEMNISLSQALAGAKSALGVSDTGIETAAGDTFGASFVDSAGNGRTAQIVARLQADLTLFQAPGTEAGKQWGSFFLQTVGANVPSALVAILVNLTTPGVLAQLNANQTTTTPPDALP